jgi:hypothetical protein
MMFVAVNQKRISKPVMLQIKLEVVSRPNVLFADCNATRRGAKKSSSPDVVHFDVVQAKDQFAVAPDSKHFYQAEVLVPSPIPPELILFADAPDVEMTQCTCAAVDVKLAAVETVSICPAPDPAQSLQEILKKLQMKKHNDLARCFDAFAAQLRKSRAERVQLQVEVKTSVRRAETDEEVKMMKCELKCEMPLCDEKDSCADCAQLGPFADCPQGHMLLCNAPDVFDACTHCSRLLCSNHHLGCYCLKRIEEPMFRMYRRSLLPQSSSSSVKNATESHLLDQKSHLTATITIKTTRGKQQMLKR